MKRQSGLMRACAVMLAILFAFPVLEAIAQKPKKVNDRWIVQLEAPPAVGYEGSHARLQAAQAGQPDSGLAATAPSITGAARLDAASAEVQAYAGWLDEQRHAVLARAGEVLGRKLEPVHVYRYLQNGFAIDLGAEEARRLAEVPGVVAVEPDQVHYLELDRGPQMIGADAVWRGDLENVDAARGENIIIGVIDSGINWEHPMFSDDPSDTGNYIYTNPLNEQLGLCSRPDVSCNEKLIGVYDYTDESNGKDLGGHGSHVAAIAAGNRRSVRLNFGGGGSNFTLSGVAPRAHIVSYKVCREEYEDDEAECLGSAIADALEQAIEDGVHVVNYSIGSDARDPWQSIGQQGTSIAELFLNLRAAGVVPVSSAGNSGNDGAGTISAPANAPWTLAVGNTTHGRLIANRAEVAGEADLAALEGTGPTLEDDLTAPVVAAEDVDSGNVLGCSSFPSGAFDDSVAVIVRGSCTFEEKVRNARRAGAVAVLVVNNLPGPPILMGGLESSAIPSFMLSNSDGIRALSAMADAPAPFASIESGVSSLISEDLSDLVAPSSSRGPAPFVPDLMKPNVVAPGSSILSAGKEREDGGESYSVLTGTSMSGPHVAGAVALVLSARPDWTVDMVVSALETTAESDPLRVNESPAGMNDRGAGRIRVDRAVNAGLYLPVTVDQFIDARPGAGGDPGQLNLAGVFSSTCTQNCEFTRTVRASRSGSWAVSSEGELDIEVEPASFSLAAGAQKELTITVSAGNINADAELDGAVVLTPSDDSMSTQYLPVGMSVAAANLPDLFSVDASGNRGRTEFDLEVLAPIEEAVYRTSSLVRPVEESLSLAQDPTPNDPYSGGAGTQTFLVDVPPNTLVLWVETRASSSQDIDLFVGFDAAGNEQAEPGEVICEGITSGVQESCRIMNPAAGTWWILVQNYQASSTHGEDFVDLEYAVLDDAEDYTLAASGPGRHPGGTLALSLAWDQPAMRRNERWLGAVGFATNDETLSDLGVVPVRIRRTGPLATEPTAIFLGETLPVVIAPGAQHDQLYFDVPHGADEVSVTVQGDSGVSADLQRMTFDEVAAAAPGTPPAGGTFEATGTGSGTGFTMTADGQPGRWYVVLENISTREALVDVTVELNESASTMSQRGLWSPRDRTIYQGIEWQRAGPGFMTWYSYDAEGLPVFYQAIGQIDPDSSVWTAPLDRISNGSGARQIYDRIGEVSLTMLAGDELVFAWRRDGFHGSEIMSPDAARTCPDTGDGRANYSGHWYSPGELVGGTTMIVTDSVQAHIRYYFDELGVGRWLLASDPETDPLNEVLELLDYRGFCPGCPERDVEIHTVGVYERSFDSESSGFEKLDFVSAEPLEHAINIEVPISKLSEPMECD